MARDYAAELMGPAPGQGMPAMQPQGGGMPMDQGQQMAGAWGVEPYNDGLVQGQKVGDTVYVVPVMKPEFRSWLQRAQQANPNLKFVIQPAGR